MDKKTERKEISKDWLTKAALILFDIFAVNFAYYMAIVLRFYVNHEFHLAGTLFMPLFVKFAPWYTICCIIVFLFFKLYDGIWKYAGLNDLNRIIWASAVTCFIQIAGTLLFIRRMPITYYVLGAAIQFMLICASRFSYRFFTVELSKRRKPIEGSVNVMIVGAGEAAMTLLHQLESDSGNIAHPVCVIDYRGLGTGKTFDGLPVVGGIDRLEEASEKYGAKSVIVADPLMPPELRDKLREQCQTAGIDMHDFFVFAMGFGVGISFQRLLAYTNGAIRVIENEKTHDFENGEQALKAFPEKYTVKSVCAISGRLCVEIERDTTRLNNADETWMREYEKTTGEEISFF